MKHGKVFLDNAIKFYTDALEQKYDDDKLRASLYANRAQANLVKGVFFMNHFFFSHSVKHSHQKLHNLLCIHQLRLICCSYKSSLQTGNYGRVIEDCKASLALDPSNVKVYFRLSSAALALEKFDVAVQYCLKGSQVYPIFSSFALYLTNHLRSLQIWLCPRN